MFLGKLFVKIRSTRRVDQAAEDAHSSSTPNSTSIFFESPCCPCLNYFIYGFLKLLTVCLCNFFSCRECSCITDKNRYIIPVSRCWMYISSEVREVADGKIKIIMLLQAALKHLNAIFTLFKAWFKHLSATFMLRI